MKNSLCKKISAVLAVLFLAAVPLSAEYNSYGIADSTEVRRAVKDKWLTAGFSEIRSRDSLEMYAADGTKFQVRVEEGMEDFLTIVAPGALVNIETTEKDGSITTSEEEVFPQGAPGSWILYRKKSTGKPVKIEWYFNQDADVYVQFRPEENKTYADFIIFGSYAAKSIPIGISFDRLYTISFEAIYQLTKKSLPWEKVQVIPGQYTDALFMAQTIRENLNRIDYAESACYNEEKKLYSFTSGKPLETDSMNPPDKDRLTLSSPGFIKWIMDGIIAPRTGKNSRLADMVAPTFEYNPLGKMGILSQTYNLFFTLDWCRNLAANAMSVRSTRELTYRNANVDVTVENFAGEIVNGQLLNTTGYIKNCGYRIEKLKSLLYTLTVSEPLYFYIAAIRQQSKYSADEMVFNEAAVLFPFFDDTGRFSCYVFENGHEMTLDEFIGKYGLSYIHLERVKVDEIFILQ